MRLKTAFACLALLLSVAPAARAADPAIPLTISHHGRLTTENDSLVEGTIELTFSVYDVAENAAGQPPTAAIWTARYSTVATKGLYAVTLGDVSNGQPALPAQLFDGSKTLWLGIKVNSESELRPRLAFYSAPYAMLASKALDSVRLGGRTLAQLDERYAPLGGGTGTDADTLDGKDASAFALKADLATTAGAVNTDSNPIHWNQLKGVPDSIQNGAITSVTATAPLQGAGTAADPLRIAAASASTPGLLVAADWVRFDAKAEKTDPRFSDARDPKPGSASYIQNGTGAQANASFNIAGSGTIGGKLKVGGGLEIAALDVAGENLVPNPDLRNGERGWESHGGYAGFAFTRTLKTANDAPVSTRRYVEIKVTSVGAQGDVHSIGFRFANLPLQTDYNMSCWVRTTSAVRGEFNFEGHEADWSGRLDQPTGRFAYANDGSWQRVSATFNTASKPNYLVIVRGFDTFGTWDVTGCQLTRGRTLANFTVTYPDLRCPNDSEETLGFCIMNNGTYDKTARQAAAYCRTQGMRLCTDQELMSAWLAGAEWCSCGWVTTGANGAVARYPMQSARGGCGNGVAIQTCGAGNMNETWGANCCR